MKAEKVEKGAFTLMVVQSPSLQFVGGMMHLPFFRRLKQFLNTQNSNIAQYTGHT